MSIVHAFALAILLLLAPRARGQAVTAQEFELPGAPLAQEPDTRRIELPSYSLFSMQHRWFRSDVSMHESTIRVSLPGVYNDGKTVLIGGIRYGLLAISRRMQLGASQPRRLHSVGFDGILVQGITEDTLLSVILNLS